MTDHNSPEASVNTYILKYDTIYIILTCIISFFLYVGGIILFNGSIKSIIGMTMMWFFATVVIIAIFYREFIHGPRTLIIAYNGIIMQFRFSKDIVISWQEILAIYAEPGDLMTIYGRWKRRGAIQPIKGLFYPVTYEAASAVRNAYFQKFNKYPISMRSK